MKNHKKLIHEGARNYRCEHCNQPLGLVSRLNRHVIILHEGRKDYRCDECLKFFCTKGNMNIHNTLLHKGTENFHCEKCSESFGREVIKNTTKEHSTKRSTIIDMTNA